MKRRIFPVLLPLAILLHSCRDTTQPLVPTRLELTSNIQELIVGDSALLTVRAYAGDKPIEWPVAWASSNANVVTVSASGLMRALSEGTAYVTATASSALLMFPIHVVTERTPGTSPRVDSLLRAPAFDTAQTVIAGGLGNICGLAGISVHCWGVNVLRRLGVADTAWAVTKPSPLNGDFQFKSLHFGGNGGNQIHCGLTPTGKAICWGLTAWGITATPTMFASEISFTTLAPGMAHVCGVDTSGAVYCWGLNESGELGRRASPAIKDPQLVSLPEKMVAVAAGFRSSCALAESGTVYCWGMTGPQLGRGDAQGSIYSSSPPAPVQSSRTFARLYGRHGTMCALTIDGIPYCWGDYSPVPKQRSTHLRFRSLAMGVNYDCGLATNALTYCWGDNRFGQLGISDRLATTEPTAPVAGGHQFRAITVGGAGTCGVTSDGAAYCWGIREGGHLGDGYSWERPLTPTKGNITFTRLSAGVESHCGITPDNRAYCWGRGGLWGMIGGITIGPKDPFQGNIFEPTLLPAAMPLRAAELADDTACFLDVNGTAWCIGPPLAAYGVLQPVDAPLPFASISLGFSHACGLTAGGEAYCWGGSGPHIGAGVLPTSIGRLSAQRVASDARFTQIIARPGYSCAIALQGEVYCWGSAAGGRLGTAVTDTVCGGSLQLPATPCTFTPKILTGLPPVREIAGTIDHVCAATESGEVYCWGRGGSETCPWFQGPVSCQRTPARVSTFVMHGLSASSYGSMTALDGTGNVYRLPAANAPPVPLNLPIPFAMYAGQCGLTSAGLAHCWGYNGTGAVGDGILEHSPVPIPVSTSIRFFRN